MQQSTRLYCELLHTLAHYDGMIRAVEEGRDGRRNSVQGKMAIAELAESATGWICRVLGGGTFNREVFALGCAPVGVDIAGYDILCLSFRFVDVDPVSSRISAKGM